MVQYYPENTWDAVDIVDSPRFHRLHTKQPAPQHGPRRRSKSYHHDQPPSPLMSPFHQPPYYFEDEPPLNYWDDTLPDDYMEDDYNDYTAPPGPHWSPFPTRLQPPRRRSLASHYQPEDHYAWYDDDNDNARPVRRRSFTTKRRFASPRMDYSDDDDEAYHSRRHPHRTPRVMGSPEASPVRHAPMEPINTLPTTSFYGQAPFPMPQPMMPSSFLPYFPTIPPAMPFHPMMMPAPPAPPPPAASAEKPASPPRPENTQSPASVPDTSPKKAENALVPLARSLSLQTSSKPRRSLFGLFGAPKAPTLIPVQDLTKDSLTRKQSLSLEKKAKALAQRSYIWCYRIKPSLTHPSDSAWVAMVPRNQTKLDPYMVFYQPDAVVKGLIRTESLPTLVTLEKEPKLTGSITVMPQAKIARVYPSMFSSSNYIELIIDCLPADSQFVVRSD